MADFFFAGSGANAMRSSAALSGPGARLFPVAKQPMRMWQGTVFFL
jgi:hypothetical protein